jgi:hypothetical protein
MTTGDVIVLTLLAGLVIGYFFGYSDGKLATEQNWLFERLDKAIKRIKEPRP